MEILEHFSWFISLNTVSQMNFVKFILQKRNKTLRKVSILTQAPTAGWSDQASWNQPWNPNSSQGL
jgi:hypothetical protein